MENTNLDSASQNPELPQRLRHRSSGKRGPRILRHLRRRLRKIKWGTMALIVVALIAVLIVAGLVLATDSNNRVSSSLSSLRRVITGLSSKPRTELTLTDFARLETGVGDLVGNLQTARRQIGLLQPLNAVDQRLRSSLVEMDAALELGLAAQEMLNGLRPTLFFLVNGAEDEQVVSQISSGERVVELLHLGRGAFARAGEHLAAARTIINSIDVQSLSPSLILNFDHLNEYHAQLVQANHILMNAPELLTTALGLAQEQQYLVLSQNSDELRPSGGYISSFGWMTIRNGRVTGYNYSPTTATSPNPPPESMADVVTIPNWWIRYNQPIYAAWDGSWYADFPSTARMSMWYYNNGNNPQSPVDGVIAIDIVGFERILRALDSVVVPGYSQVVTPDNFRQMVYAIREADRGDLPHKQFLAALYQQIFRDWQAASSDPETSSRLIGELLEAIQQKHIMFYFTDENLNAAVQSLGWSGTQTPARHHDYLMVADANLGNKSNRSVMRSMTYDVDIQPDGTLRSRATVGYDYSDRIAATDPAVNPAHHGPLDYNNLLQVFVPYDSEIESTNNLRQEPRLVEADNHTIFVSRVNIAYDSTQRFQYTYHTPALVENVGPYQRYRLQLQKQPGTRGDVVNVQVTLPANAAAIGITPEPAASYHLDRPILEFRLTLETDQWVEVIYQLE